VIQAAAGPDTSRSSGNSPLRFAPLADYYDSSFITTVGESSSSSGRSFTVADVPCGG
jgi:hypothetical protein